MANETPTTERKRAYSLQREGATVTYSVKEVDGDTFASISFDLPAVFNIPAEGIAADAVCSAIRTNARYAVATKEPAEWQAALDELMEQWLAGDWAVEGEGSVPFGAGAPLTKAVLHVYGEKFGGSASAAAKAINDKLLAQLVAANVDWDALNAPDKNKMRRSFEKAAADADPNVALFLAELYAAQAAARAAKKLEEQRARLAAGATSSLF